MSLALHQTWLLITTVILTSGSILVLIIRQHIPWVFKYNESFRSLFGVEPQQASWFQYLFSWLIGTCMAALVLTLVVNINENVLLLVGQRGIPLDPMIVLLAIGGIIVSIILITAALIPVIVIPVSSLSAFGILLLLHLLGIPYNFSYLPSLLSVFVYFAAMAVGFVGVFLALYLLIRYYLAVPLLNRFRKQKSSSISTVENSVPSL